MKNYKIGSTAGIYNLFQISNFNITKQYCRKLTAHIYTNEAIQKNMNKTPKISFNDKIDIIRVNSCVDEIYTQEECSLIYTKHLIKFGVVVLFIGSNVIENEKPNNLDMQLMKIDFNVVYFKHTDKIFSYLLMQ